MSTLASRHVRIWLIQIVGISVVVGYVLLADWTAVHASYDIWSGLVIVPVVLALHAHLIVRAGRADPDPLILRLLVAASVLKVLATLGRYLMAFVWYGGATDAGLYHTEGARLAESYRLGIFDTEIGKSFIGTGFVRVVTGLLYAVTGPSLPVAYAFFALLSFWGVYFFYRAFRVAVPDGQHRRYAALVLLLPSMLFWPAQLGKEAWMTLGLGLAAFGAARLLTGVRGWMVPLAAGLIATAMVRPHITAALFVGVALGLVVRRSRRPATPLTPLAKAAGLVVVAGVGLVIVTRAAAFLGLEEVSASSVDAAIDSTQHRTSDAGSAFDSTAVNSPVDLPMAAVSVLFRPFIFEAHNVQAGIAALEGTALLVLAAMSIGRWRGLPRRLLRQPYLILCLTYILLFVYAFSNFSNFGVLTRERVMVLPFVLVLFALPRAVPHVSRSKDQSKPTNVSARKVST